jgi:ribosomal protein S12 methylthiotransferase
MTKVAITTLGCAKNLLDSENMVGVLQAAGYQVTTNTTSADICIVNTCTFIQDSTNQSIDTILELGEKKKKLIVSGCMAQRYKEDIFKEFPQVKAVIGTGGLEEIINAVHWVSSSDEPKSFMQGAKGYIANSTTPRLRLSGGASAYVKISEGCNHKCTFCIIPSLRGTLKSRSMEEITQEVKALVDEGVKEIVLVSQDSTAYGIDLYKGKRMLAPLLEKLALETGAPWIRVMYSYPGELSDELLEVIGKYDNIVNYIDIPLQHSHPETLKRMKRPNLTLQVVERIKAKLPQATIRTTFIVGFPGETEEEFQDLANFIETHKLDRIGVFTYSQEETTSAAVLGDQLPEKIKRQRQKKLLGIQEKISLEKNTALVGTTQRVLVEKLINGKLKGRREADAPEIDNHVIISGDNIDYLENLLGEFIDVQITAAYKFHLEGVLL